MTLMPWSRPALTTHFTVSGWDRAMTTTWVAPAADEGPITFHLTLVQSYSLWWGRTNPIVTTLTFGTNSRSRSLSLSHSRLFVCWLCVLSGCFV